MNILIISQCSKNALTQTRRILDQFAERCGERTWQTAITQAGLATLHQLLRQTARKNTAVACYWTHGKNQTDLLWIVGDKSQFNAQGRVPTNRTQRDILRSDDEITWQNASLMQIAATLAALLHDLGKASIYFQEKLHSPTPKADPYRHEWISLRLFEQMIDGCADDNAWLTRLADWEAYRASHPDWMQSILRDKTEGEKQDCEITSQYHFAHFPPFARWIAWLIVSHHRLPFYNDNYRKTHWYSQFSLADDKIGIDAWFNTFLQPLPYWQRNPQIKEDSKNWQFAADPTTNADWQKQLSRWCNKALHSTQLPTISDNPYLWSLSRLCLMTGDHNYSSKRRENSKPNENQWQENFLVANTLKNHCWNQQLPEHLIGVARETARIARLLPKIDHELPTLNNHREFRKPAIGAKFAWQNKAVNAAKKLAQSTKETGFFGVNLASTGCGKTLANAKIAYALANEEGARFTIALGLRTLTLQTGNALRDLLQLDKDELAILIGSNAIRELNEAENAQDDPENGSASAEALIDQALDFADSGVSDGGIGAEHLGTVVEDGKAKQLLFTPLISCTIDYLMQLSEQQRGGRYIAPMLRLMSSDLIIDEPDDFGMEDSPALTRLVYWAGLLGSRVILSSATLPEAFVQGLFNAYRDGRIIYNREHNLPQAPIACAWFDEFASATTACTDASAFTSVQQQFYAKRIEKLSEQSCRRKADWLPVPSANYDALAKALLDGALSLHQRHAETTADGKTISFGLLRFANIRPLVHVAKAFLTLEIPEDYQLHLICYHSQLLLMQRSLLEAHLDDLLNRRNGRSLAAHPSIQYALANSETTHHLFIVLGSPVTEVGRDHDYDWAIVEPSSMRSLIQLAGRVWRHRPEKTAGTANLLIWEKNFRVLNDAQQDKDLTPLYVKPGFETPDALIRTPRAKTVLFSEQQLEKVDATPKLMLIANSIVATHPKTKTHFFAALSNLEQWQIERLFLKENIVNAYRESSNMALLSAHFAKLTPFRKSSPQTDYIALPNEDAPNRPNFILAENAWNHAENLSNFYRNRDFTRETIAFSNPQIQPFLYWTYESALQAMAKKFPEKEDKALAQQFASISLRELTDSTSYSYHPWLGFYRD